MNESASPNAEKFISIYCFNFYAYELLMFVMTQTMHYHFDSNFDGFLFSTLLANILLIVNLLFNRNYSKFWHCGLWIIFIIGSFFIMQVFTSLDSINYVDYLERSVDTPNYLKVLLASRWLIFPIFILLAHWQMKRVAVALAVERKTWIKVFAVGGIINSIIIFGYALLTAVIHVMP